MQENDRAIKVLLAEDSEDDVFIMKEVFKDSQWIKIIGVVSNGAEVGAYLKQEAPYENCSKPDMIFLDINMPKKNGLEVLEEIKRDPKFKGLPVVMWTSSGREEDINRSYDRGACGYIVKPMTYQSFVDIAKAFSQYWGIHARVPR